MEDPRAGLAVIAAAAPTGAAALKLGVTGIKLSNGYKRQRSGEHAFHVISHLIPVLMNDFSPFFHRALRTITLRGLVQGLVCVYG